MGCNIEKERKGKGNSKSKQRIYVTVLISKNGGRHVNFRHQAEKDKTHPAQKESFTSKEQKENVHHFQKKDKKCKKIKEDKNWRRKGKFGFPCHANQFGIEGGEKIPSSSVRSLSPKSSVCFFVRGPIGPRRRRWRKTG